MGRITGGDLWRYAGFSISGREMIELVEPLHWHVGGPEGETVITVPAGFRSDFASIPWGVRNLFPAFGPWALAAILHDYLYLTEGEGGRWTRKFADEQFREAMEAIAAARPDGQPPAWKRAIMYRAVRVGGAGGWGR